MATQPKKRRLVTEETLPELVDQKLETVDVRDFGAVGNGVANDTAAIQAALAASAGKRLVFPGNKKYLIKAALTVTGHDTTIDFGSATLLADVPNYAIRVAGTPSSRIRSPRVLGGYIDLKNTAENAIQIQYCDDPVVERVYAQNANGSNGAVVSLTGCTHARVTDVAGTNIGTGVTLVASTYTTVSGCVFSNMRKDGVLIFSQSNYSSVTGCVINGFNLISESGRAGIHAYGSDFVSVAGNTVVGDNVLGTSDSPKIRFRDCRLFACAGNVTKGARGAGIGVIALGDIGTGAGHGTITGNTVEATGGVGISVGLGTGAEASDLFPVTISGNHIKGVVADEATTGIGINVVAGADMTTISGNTIEDTAAEGIVSAAVSTVVGNTIRSVGKVASGSRAGIFITGSEAVVAGNTVFDDASSPTTANGLRVLAGAKVHLGVNSFRNATTAAIRNDGEILSQLGGISTAKIGFFGKDPVSRPAAVANATDAASAITQLNALLSRLRDLGLITT